MKIMKPYNFRAIVFLAIILVAAILLSGIPYLVSHHGAKVYEGLDFQGVPGVPGPAPGVPLNGGNPVPAPASNSKSVGSPVVPGGK